MAVEEKAVSKVCMGTFSFVGARAEEAADYYSTRVLDMCTEPRKYSPMWTDNREKFKQETVEKFGVTIEVLFDDLTDKK